jgi:hypothetical protein
LQSARLVAAVAELGSLDGIERHLKGRFPPDLLIVVFGPLLVVVTALVVGSLIYHAAQWGRVPMVLAIAGICIAYLLFLVRSLKRRFRPSGPSNANAHDESTPTI